MRILITVSRGTGESTVIAGLMAMAFQAVDTDAPEWTEMKRFSEGDPNRLGAEFDSTWREDRISELLANARGGPLFVSACVPDQAKFDPRFDYVVLLTAPAPVMALVS